MRSYVVQSFGSARKSRLINSSGVGASSTWTPWTSRAAIRTFVVGACAERDRGRVDHVQPPVRPARRQPRGEAGACPVGPSRWQQKADNWLLPGSDGPLEMTIVYEQVAVDRTAWLARMEPDPVPEAELRLRVARALRSPRPLRQPARPGNGQEGGGDHGHRDRSSCGSTRLSGESGIGCGAGARSFGPGDAAGVQQHA